MIKALTPYASGMVLWGGEKPGYYPSNGVCCGGARREFGFTLWPMDMMVFCLGVVQVIASSILLLTFILNVGILRIVRKMNEEKAFKEVFQQSPQFSACLLFSQFLRPLETACIPFVCACPSDSLSQMGSCPFRLVPFSSGRMQSSGFGFVCVASSPLIWPNSLPPIAAQGAVCD